MINHSVKLSHDNVIALRRVAKTHGLSEGIRYSTQFLTTERAASEAIRGVTYKSINDIEPPMDLSNSCKDLCAEARKMYLAGATYKDIIKELGVTIHFVSLWCSDLAFERREKAYTKRLEEYREKHLAKQRKQEATRLARTQSKRF